MYFQENKGIVDEIECSYFDVLTYIRLGYVTRYVFIFNIRRLFLNCSEQNFSDILCKFKSFDNFKITHIQIALHFQVFFFFFFPPFR